MIVSPQYLFVFSRNGANTFEGTIQEVADEFNCTVHEVETALYTDSLFKEKWVLARNYRLFEKKMQMINKNTLVNRKKRKTLNGRETNV